MMVKIAPEEAILHAREALGLPAVVTGRALRVERLDAPGTAYYLVVLASGEREQQIAVIDAETGALDQNAEVTGRESHIAVNMEQAIATARFGDRATARLVWRPCRASYSPLFPIWEISSAGERRYVDQQGRLWEALSPIDRRGGS